jgi:hypothetical protein
MERQSVLQESIVSWGEDNPAFRILAGRLDEALWLCSTGVNELPCINPAFERIRLRPRACRGRSGHLHDHPRTPGAGADLLPARLPAWGRDFPARV